MHVKSRALALLAVLAVTASPAAAQLTSEQARAKADSAPVVVVLPDGSWRGHLIDIDEETVTILVPGGVQKTLWLADVLRVDAKRKDSPGDGAFGGMLALVAWCALVCGQGADSTAGYRASIVSAGVAGLALGAMVDARHTSSLSLYRRPSSAPVRKSSGVFFTVRF